MANENIVDKIEQIPAVPKTEVLPDTTLEKKPETGAETLTTQKTVEQKVVTPKEKIESVKTTSTAPVITDDYHVRREKEIDAYLSDGLGETFLAMTPIKQKEFKEEGEKTAKKINILLDSTKINLGKIVDLIRRWLKLITGVNRFFLDQEAKIKADKIIDLKNKI